MNALASNFAPAENGSWGVPPIRSNLARESRDERKRKKKKKKKKGFEVRRRTDERKFEARSEQRNTRCGNL